MATRSEGNWKYWNVLKAVQALGGAVMAGEITAWLDVHFPDDDNSDARDNAALLSVNDPNRRHHDHGRKNFLSDQGNKKDVLFKVGQRANVKFELYDPLLHGVWDIRPGATGTWVAVQVEAPAEIALREARAQVENAPAPPIGNDHDVRVWELRAVALREGQGEFRQSLLDAYEKQCSITGCRVEQILEAAHIRPYRGEHTHRVDNGLLLRADIHTLFDKGMIYIDAGSCIRIDDRLIGSEYELLRGRPLRLPSDPAHHPHPDHLAHHRQFGARQSA